MVLSQLMVVVAGIPGLNRWAIYARVVIDVEGFFDHEVLAAEVAAFQQKELGCFTGACVNRLQARRLAFMRTGAGEHFVAASGTMNQGQASPFAQSVGSKGKNVVKGASMFVPCQSRFLVWIGRAMPHFEKRRVAGNEIELSLQMRRFSRISCTEKESRS